MPERVRPGCGRGPLLYNAPGGEFSPPSPHRLPDGQKGDYSETPEPASPRWVCFPLKCNSLTGWSCECRDSLKHQCPLCPALVKGRFTRGCLLLPGASIKAQICSLVELLATTLNQAHALFYTLPEGVLPDPSLPCGLLFSTLETITSQHPTGELCAFLLIPSADLPPSQLLCQVLGDESVDWEDPVSCSTNIVVEL